MMLQIDTDNTPTKQIRAIANLLVMFADERDVVPAGLEFNAAAIGFGKAPLPAQVSELTPAPDAAAPALTQVHTAITAELTGEVDSAGVAYNPAQHSSSKAKNKDGSWKKRRGATAVPAAPVATPPPATTAAPPALPDLGEISRQIAAELPPPPPPPPPAAVAAAPPPPPPPPPAAVAAPDAPTFRSVVKRVNEATAAKTLTPARVAQLLEHAGVPGGELQTLITRADLIPTVDALLTAELAGK